MAYACFIQTKPSGLPKMQYPCYLTKAGQRLQNTFRTSFPVASCRKIQFVGNSDKLPQTASVSAVTVHKSSASGTNHTNWCVWYTKGHSPVPNECSNYKSKPRGEAESLTAQSVDPFIPYFKNRPACLLNILV